MSPRSEDLFDFVDDYIKHSPNGGLAERDAATITRQCLKAMIGCHTKGFIHRDLKLENFVLVGADRREKKKQRESHVQGEPQKGPGERGKHRQEKRVKNRQDTLRFFLPNVSFIHWKRSGAKMLQNEPCNIC